MLSASVPRLWTSLIEAPSSQAGFEMEFISVASITERMCGLLYLPDSLVFITTAMASPGLLEVGFSDLNSGQ